QKQICFESSLGKPNHQLRCGQRHDQRHCQRRTQAQLEHVTQQTALVARLAHLGDQHRQPLQHSRHCYSADQFHHRLQLRPQRDHGRATGQRQHLVQSRPAKEIDQDDGKRGQDALDGSQCYLLLCFVRFEGPAQTGHYYFCRNNRASLTLALLFVTSGVTTSIATFRSCPYSCRDETRASRQSIPGASPFHPCWHPLHRSIGITSASPLPLRDPIRRHDLHRRH